uniref:Nudix hydrolase domain-containing protein n=1 Tax=Angiostrongylus cantonensis TaxID=6313 RepID=A0A0K0CZK7_ANGCA
LLHIAEDDTTENGVKCQWIDAKCLSDVKLTASAFTDHLPKSMERMLEKIVAVNTTGLPVGHGSSAPELASTVTI